MERIISGSTGSSILLVNTPVLWEIVHLTRSGKGSAHLIYFLNNDNALPIQCNQWLHDLALPDAL